MRTIITIKLLIIAVIGIGWVMNIIKLSKCDFESPFKAEALHAVGIIPVVGAVTGWMDLGK